MESISLGAIKQEISCFRCGVCCSKFQPRLGSHELYLLAEKLNVSHERFVAEYTDHRWPGTQSFLLRHQDGACIFLQRTPEGLSLCRVHSFKPSCCKDWKAGSEKPECREGLKSFYNRLS